MFLHNISKHKQTKSKLKKKLSSNSLRSYEPGVAGLLDKWFGELLDELFDDRRPVLFSVWWRWFSVSLLLLLLLFLVELVNWWLLVSLLVILLLFVWMVLLFRFDDITNPFGINALWWWWWWCIAKWLWCKLGGSEAIAAQTNKMKEKRGKMVSNKKMGFVSFVLLNKFFYFDVKENIVVIVTWC